MPPGRRPPARVIALVTALGLVAAVVVVVATRGSDTVAPDDAVAGTAPSAAPVDRASPNGQLAGSWDLVAGTSDGVALDLPSAPITLRVSRRDGTTQLGGRAVCNHDGAEVEVTGSAIDVDDVAGSAVGCYGAPGRVEEAYLQAFGVLTAYQRSDDVLVLTGPDVRLRLRPSPRLPVRLVGPTWQLDGPGRARLTLTGRRLTVTDRCGTRIDGTWIEDAGSVVVTSSRYRGPGRCQHREPGRSLLALLGEFRAELDGRRLVVRPWGGRPLVFEAVVPTR